MVHKTSAQLCCCSPFLLFLQKFTFWVLLSFIKLDHRKLLKLKPCSAEICKSVMVRGGKEKKKYMWRSKDEALKHKKICICTFPVMHVKAASVLFAWLPLFHAVKLRTAIITVFQPVFYEPISLCSVDFYMLSFCLYDSCWYNLPHPHLHLSLISQSPTQASLPPPGNSILIPIIAECGSGVNHSLFKFCISINQVFFSKWSVLIFKRICACLRWSLGQSNLGLHWLLEAADFPAPLHIVIVLVWVIRCFNVGFNF